MTRVAVLGANGQVGAEVCLLLSGQPGIELVPICRSAAGSSYLRYHGLDCRHGAPADPAQAADLLAEADLVLNFALAQGLPRQNRDTHRRLIENAARHSAPGASVLYMSTMSVYRRTRRAGLRFRSAYAREKLFCERCTQRIGVQTGKPTYVFRLGHVCGDLQSLTSRIRLEVASGPLALRRGGRYTSNTVYTASIVEAVLQVLEGRIEPGVHDLVTQPEWSWQEVYAYEASEVGCRLALVPEGATPRRAFRAALGAPLRLVQGAPELREAARSLLAGLSERANLRLQAMHYQARAAREIQALLAASASFVDLPDPWEARRPVRILSNPAELRTQARYRLPDRAPGFVRSA